MWPGHRRDGGAGRRADANRTPTPGHGGGRGGGGRGDRRAPLDDGLCEPHTPDEPQGHEQDQDRALEHGETIQDASAAAGRATTRHLTEEV